MSLTPNISISLRIVFRYSRKSVLGINATAINMCKKSNNKKKNSG